jgi:transcriptional regulator EpsA
LVILSKLEQEYLLSIIESAIHLREPRQFFLWAQGQLQALLPHRLMVCLQFDPAGALLRTEALHGSLLDQAALARACALAQRAASGGASLPWLLDAHEPAPGAAQARLRDELAACGYDNLLLDGSGAVAGGATVFALFGLPMRPGARHAYFLSLLLPHLHLALLRLAQPKPAGAGREPAPARRPLSAREADILRWLREGKRNDEIALILGISALTVKNHLQRIYKLLGVHNRTAAVAWMSPPLISHK